MIICISFKKRRDWKMGNIETIKSLPFPYFVTSDEGEILIVNDLLKKNTLPNIEQLYINDVFDEWTMIKDERLIQAKIKEESFVFIKEKTKDHHVYIGICSNGLEQLLTEYNELQVANLNLDAIIENSYDGIYITDIDGNTLKTNSAIERITGIPKEYYLNKNVNDLIKKGILDVSVTDKVLKEKKTVSLVQKNFSGQETLLTGNPVFNENGDIESVVTNIRDLSDLNNLQRALRKANELNKSYRKEIERLQGSPVVLDEHTIVKNEQMKIIYNMASRIVNVDATVLILGETGVGKDVLAKFIYNHSERSREGKFIKINCGAIPPDLLESELFGYAGGAFTGANKQGKPGMFELADNGVLFLDEIGEMPLNLQVKLLRVIQEREIQRIGGTSSKKINVRLLAATNRDLKEMVKCGGFREDLYYRLNVVPISIPPLRERVDEICPLANLYLENINTKYGTLKQVNDELMSFFRHYHWPGNVRELSNLLERIVLLNNVDLLGIEHLPREYRNEVSNEIVKVEKFATLKDVTESAEENLLKKAAEKYKTTYEIAKVLETSQPTIVRKLKKYDIKIVN
jgi:PAS domain S-box-containing protein